MPRAKKKVIINWDEDERYFDFLEGSLDPHPLDLMAGNPDDPPVLHATSKDPEVYRRRL